MEETKTKKPSKDQDFIDVCEYIKSDILYYGDDMKITTKMALRVKGLASGQFIANKKHTPQANYDYKTILLTLKLCKGTILSAMHGKNFGNEMQKFNYIMAIVEGEINDVCLRLKRVEKSKEKVETMQLDNMENEGAEYKPKSKTVSKNLSELW